LSVPVDNLDPWGAGVNRDGGGVKDDRFYAIAGQCIPERLEIEAVIVLHRIETHCGRVPLEREVVTQFSRRQSGGKGLPHRRIKERGRGAWLQNSTILKEWAKIRKRGDVLLEIAQACGI